MKITAYKSEIDGTLFESEQDMIKHDAKLTLSPLIAQLSSFILTYNADSDLAEYVDQDELEILLQAMFIQHKSTIQTIIDTI